MIPNISKGSKWVEIAGANNFKSRDRSTDLFEINDSDFFLEKQIDGSGSSNLWNFTLIGQGCEIKLKEISQFFELLSLVDETLLESPYCFPRREDFIDEYVGQKYCTLRRRVLAAFSPSM